MVQTIDTIPDVGSASGCHEHIAVAAAVGVVCHEADATTQRGSLVLGQLPALQEQPGGESDAGGGGEQECTAVPGSDRDVAPEAEVEPVSPGLQARLLRRVAGERGAATAEYAVATMAAVGFAGLLVLILRGDEVRGILTELVRNALTVG